METDSSSLLLYAILALQILLLLLWWSVNGRLARLEAQARNPYEPPYQPAVDQPG